MACLTDVWSSSYTDQCEFISNMLDVMQSIESQSQSIVLHQNSEPTTNEMNAAWIEQTGLSGLPEKGSTFYWYSPTTEVIENIYIVCDDVAAGNSSFEPISYHTKDRSLDFIYLGELFIDQDTAIASFTLAIPQTARHLFLTHTLRAVDAGVSVTFGMRLNGVSSATYHGSRLDFDAAAVAGVSVIAQTSFVQPSHLPGAGSTWASQAAASGYAWLPNYAVLAANRTGGQYLIWRNQGFIGAGPTTPSTANRNLSATFGFNITNTTFPVTSINFIGPAASFRRGSRFTVWGLG